MYGTDRNCHISTVHMFIWGNWYVLLIGEILWERIPGTILGTVYLTCSHYKQCHLLECNRTRQFTSFVSWQESLPDVLHTGLTLFCGMLVVEQNSIWSCKCIGVRKVESRRTEHGVVHLSGLDGAHTVCQLVAPVVNVYTVVVSLWMTREIDVIIKWPLASATWNTCFSVSAVHGCC